MARDYKLQSVAMGRFWSIPENRRKMMRAQVHRPPTVTKLLRQAASANMRSLWRTHRNEMMAGVRKGHRIQKRDKTVEKMWMNPEFRNKVILENLSQGRNHPSRCQIRLLRILQREIRGLKREYRVDHYSLDIARPWNKRGIEVDGPYWHEMNKANGFSYRKRRRHLKKLGWMIMRIRAKREYSNHDIDKCIRFLRHRKEND